MRSREWDQGQNGPPVSIRKLFASDRGLFANESDGDKTTSAPSAFRSSCGRSAWIGARADFRAKVHLHHAFFEHAATPGAERLIVFPPKQRLSQARRRRISKANDFQCRNHYRIGVTVLLHRHQEGSADIRPGHTEKVTASGNSIRQFRQRHRSTQ